MKSSRSKNGIFSERPYFKDDEIETICSDELSSVGLLPSNPEPIRIDRFLEKRFGVSHRYEDLPDGVLGLTLFGSKGAEAVLVSRALDDEATTVADRRVRSTLAHEAGHCLLHSHLFALGQANPLFGDFSNPLKPKILCRDIVTLDGRSNAGYDGKWWEFQANSAMGSLLLPRILVERALEQFLISQGSFGLKRIDPARRPIAARHLCELFDTNPIVARLRIDRLYPPADNLQFTL